jgi:hypothetical protein
MCLNGAGNSNNEDAVYSAFIVRNVNIHICGDWAFFLKLVLGTDIPMQPPMNIT